VDEALDPRVLGGDQHVDESIYVDGVRSERVIHRPWNGAERRVVEHVVSALASCAAGVEVSDVALDHAEAGTALQIAGEHFVEVGAMAGREVVDTDNSLPQPEKRLEEVGADEPGNACDDPDLGRGDQLFAKTPIRCGDHELTVEELLAGPIQGGRAQEHVHPIMRAASRGFCRRDRASSIPITLHRAAFLNRGEATCYALRWRGRDKDHVLLCRETA